MIHQTTTIPLGLRLSLLLVIGVPVMGGAIEVLPPPGRCPTSDKWYKVRELIKPELYAGKQPYPVKPWEEREYKFLAVMGIQDGHVKPEHALNSRDASQIARMRNMQRRFNAQRKDTEVSDV